MGGVLVACGRPGVTTASGPGKTTPRRSSSSQWTRARAGACPAMEIPFASTRRTSGRGQMLGGALGDDAPQKLADRMHAAWVRFAAEGDPGRPRYDLERHCVMRLGL